MALLANIVVNGILLFSLYNSLKLQAILKVIGFLINGVVPNPLMNMFALCIAVPGVAI